MTFYTHRNDMVIPHYGCVDVSEDYRWYGMTYYTHYNDAVTPDYGRVDDSAKYPFE
jgi:hypothetical protein